MGILQGSQCAHAGCVRKLSMILLPHRGGWGWGVMHNRPFNNIFPWLPGSCLKDEPPFILGSEVNCNLFLGRA